MLPDRAQRLEGQGGRSIKRSRSSSSRGWQIERETEGIEGNCLNSVSPSTRFLVFVNQIDVAEKIGEEIV